VLVPRHPRIVKFGLQRLHGVQKIGSKHGLLIDRVDLDYSSEAAAALAAKWKHGERPTAVFTFNDEYGALLMGALHDVGLSVPEDIALVGCDNLPICEVVRPRLTTTRMSSDAAVRAIATFFDAAIQGQDVGEPPQALSSPQLIVRDSG
jgi:DNA-binding LacI/PurR family transcriptional regulator